MGTAARIRANRIRAGKSQVDVAKSLDLNIAWYADLESRDHEFAATLTMFKAMELASILGVKLHELLDAPPINGKGMTLIELPDQILAYAKHAGISVEQLEEQIGWELRNFIAHPIQGATELPIQFFQVVATLLGIDWLLLVPDESQD